jgi:hypothetical protein
VTRHPLDGCRTKLARADEHLLALVSEVEAYESGDQIIFEGEYRPRRKQYAYVVRIVNEPPLRLGTILGDYAHNLRSALDNLMWQLVLLRKGTPTRRTQFPIFVRRADYRKQAPTMIRGVARRDRGTIERMQPYRDGRVLKNIHPLAFLGWVSNMDKHRVVHPFNVFPTTPPGRKRNFKANKNAGKTRMVHVADRLEDGADLVRFQLAPIGPNPRVRILGWTGVLAFTDRHLSLRDLVRIREGVREVFDVLSPEFDA